MLKCNAKCKHCYISYEGNISANDLFEMSNKLVKNHTLIINGTEVLLDSDYLKSLELSRQKRVLTNGIVIHNNKDLLNQIYNTGTKGIGLSYHYVIHSDISTVNYSVIKESIKNIKESGLAISLMCTINKDNYNKIEEICENAIILGANQIRFFNYLMIGNAMELSEENVLTEEQIKIFFDQLAYVRSIYDKKLLSIKRNGTFGKNYISSSCHFECVAGYDEVVIAPNMKVYPCIYLTKPGFEIGEYRDGNILLYNAPTHDKTICLTKELFNNKKSVKF